MKFSTCFGLQTNFVLFLVLLCKSATVDSTSEPIPSPKVITPLATFEGLRSFFDDKPVDVFLGIPYARPPIGSLRFRKPVPINDHLGLVKAIELSPQCYRWKDPRVHLPWTSNTTQSEDCLYLNIWVPANKSHKKLPVMVYSYGYDASSINLEVFNGLALAALGDVIVVTVSWRTGIFGYFYGGSRYAPGNVGGHDQIVALQWVQEFISHFGGDESRVTFFGQGRGAFWTSIFNTLPAAKGLYVRSIIQSATPRIIQTQEQALTVAKKIAAAVGCLRYNNIDNVCMRKVDVEELIRTYGSIVLCGEDLYPVYDGEFIVQESMNSIDHSNTTINQGEVLSGSNRDEGALLMYHDMPEMFQRGIVTKINRTVAVDILQRLLQKRLGHIPSNDMDRIFNYYLSHIQDDDSSQLESSLIAAVSASVTCPEALYSASIARTNPVYRYFFTEDTAYNPFGGWHLSTHFQEVQYIFGMPILYPEFYTEAQYQLSLDLIKIWSSFAYKGKPHHKTFDWSLSNAKNRVFLELNSLSSSVGFGPLAKDCDFWATVRYQMNPLF